MQKISTFDRIVSRQKIFTCFGTLNIFLDAAQNKIKTSKTAHKKMSDRRKILESEDPHPSPALQRKFDALAERHKSDKSAQGRAAKSGKSRPPRSRKSKDSPAKPKRPVGRPPKSPRMPAGVTDDLLADAAPRVRLVSDIITPSLTAVGAERHKEAWGSHSVSGGTERYKPRTPKRRNSPSRTAAAGLEQSASNWESSATTKRPQPVITSDSWDPTAAAGPEDIESRLVTPAYGGDNDPENVLFLGQYLADNYKRISLDQACREDIDKVDEEDGTIDLEIWFKEKGRWDRMGNEVQSRWAKRLKNKPGSVCSSLVKDLLGFTDSAYAKIKYKFEDTSGYFMEGIYKAKTDNVPKFAVLVEMPTGISLTENLLKGGVGALGLTTVLGGLGAKYLYDKKQNIYKGKVDFTEALKVVDGAILDTEKQLKKLSTKQNISDEERVTLDLLTESLKTLQRQQRKYRYRASQERIKKLEEALKKQRTLPVSDEAKISDLDSELKNEKIRSLTVLRSFKQDSEQMLKEYEQVLLSLVGQLQEAYLTGLKQLAGHLKATQDWDKPQIDKLGSELNYLLGLYDATNGKSESEIGEGRQKAFEQIKKLSKGASSEQVIAAATKAFPMIELILLQMKLEKAEGAADLSPEEYATIANFIQNLPPFKQWSYSTKGKSWDMLDPPGRISLANTVSGIVLNKSKWDELTSVEKSKTAAITSKLPFVTGTPDDIERILYELHKTANVVSSELHT